MFVDIYSLGRGLVSSREQYCCFTINHLQVRRGYRYEKIPESVRAVACGPLGTWKQGDDPPQLEIVHHHVAPVVWPKLPERWRAPAIQSAGTSRVMVPVTNPLQRAMYPPGVDPYTFEMSPSPSAPELPNLDELLPGLVTQIRTPSLSGGPQKARAEPEESSLGDRPAQRTSLAPRAAVVVEEVVAAAVEAASGRCQGETGSGSSCPRKTRPGSMYCGAHGKKAVTS